MKHALTIAIIVVITFLVIIFSLLKLDRIERQLTAINLTLNQAELCQEN